MTILHSCCCWRSVRKGSFACGIYTARMSLKVDCRANDADKHEFDINNLLFHKGKLYSGADDGKIIVWSPDLKKLGEVQSNPCSVFCLAGNESSIYSCSNEGTVKAFELDSLKEKGVLIEDSQTEYWKVCCDNDCLYTGDHQGNIKVFKNDQFYGGLNVSDPVKDMVIYKSLLFTANLDLVITDLKLESKKLQFGMKGTIIGRPPITLVGEKYLALTSREGMDIVLHENSESSRFKAVTTVKGAHEKVINALTGTNWNNEHYIISGGWDKVLKQWKIDGDNLKLDSSCELDLIINTIAIGDQAIYAGGSDGHLVRINLVK